MQGQGHHSDCNGMVRWEEDGGGGVGGGWRCPATTVLSMTPNEITEIGTGEEEVGLGMVKRGRCVS